MYAPRQAFRWLTIDGLWRCAILAATTRDPSNATDHNELTARRSTAARSANHRLTMGRSTTDDGLGGPRRASSVICGASIDATTLSERARPVQRGSTRSGPSDAGEDAGARAPQCSAKRHRRYECLGLHCAG